MIVKDYIGLKSEALENIRESLLEYYHPNYDVVVLGYVNTLFPREISIEELKTSRIKKCNYSKLIINNDIIELQPETILYDFKPFVSYYFKDVKGNIIALKDWNRIKVLFELFKQRNIKDLIIKLLEEIIGLSKSNNFNVLDGLAESLVISKQAQLSQITREIETLEQNRKELEREINDLEKLDQQRLIRNIENIKEVDRVLVYRNSIAVITKPLRIGLWNIGRFSITLPNLKVYSIDSQIQHEFPHPHVNEEGKVCTNDFSILAKSLNRLEWDAVISYIIKLLQTYNEGHDYIKLENYLDEEEKKSYYKYLDDNDIEIVLSILPDRIIFENVDGEKECLYFT